MLISIICPNLNLGGAERVTVNLVNELLKRNYEVDLILLKKSGPFLKDLSKKCNLVTLNKKRARYSFFSLYKYLVSSKSIVLISTLRETSILSGIVFKFPFIKQKLVLREASPDMENSLIKKTIIRVSYNSADIFISNSKFTMDFFEKDIFRPSKKTVKKIIIGNPLIDNNFEKRLEKEFNDEWLEDKKLKTIISCGRLDPVKRFDLLIKAFEIAYRFDDTLRLILIGNGEEYENINFLIVSLKLDKVIKIINFVSNPSRVFKKANLFVSCSKTEGFSNVLVEALASGIKVLSTNSGGPNDILDNGKYGKLIEIENEEDLAKEIVVSLNENQDIELNKKRARYYSSENIVNQYLENIESVLNHENRK